jgi:hypothetical protein
VHQGTGQDLALVVVVVGETMEEQHTTVAPC